MRNLRLHSRTATARLTACAVAALACTAVLAADNTATGSPEPITTHAVEPSIGKLGAEHVNARAAASLLKGQGLTTHGSPQSALTWTDAGGVNYLLTTKETDPEDNVPSGVTHNGVLRVYQVTGLGTREEKLSQLLAETNDVEPLPDQEMYDYVGCQLDGGIGFVRHSLRVTDTNADGIGEVSVGWWRACKGDVGPTGVHLTTFTDGQTYTLSGQGSVRNPTAAERRAGIFPAEDAEISPVKASAAPRGSSWPRTTLEAATALFYDLYH
jgi:hypothetical protein